MHAENLMQMWDVQPTIENRIEIGHENKGALEHPWEDPKAWTTTKKSGGLDGWSGWNDTTKWKTTKWQKLYHEVEELIPQNECL